MNQRAAFDATIKLAQERGMEMWEGSDIGLAHLLDMQARITDDFTDGKLGRWLGWAQCAVVAASIGITLDDMKHINMMHRD